MQEVGFQGGYDEGDDDNEDIADLAPSLGRESRAFDRLPIEVQSTTIIAAKTVENYTLYKCPLFSAGKVLLLVNSAWRKAMHEPRQVEITKDVVRYVCAETSLEASDR
jgi:hypothetical protein